MLGGLNDFPWTRSAGRPGWEECDGRAKGWRICRPGLSCSLARVTAVASRYIHHNEERYLPVHSIRRLRTEWGVVYLGTERQGRRWKGQRGKKHARGRQG